ncbi:type IV toxin-antitoxin system AbiEi family antitoxin domain-containing protein [Actinorugispora endophytica]|nr:type IV toxin-antitoxin system AbiEi family antitoxin domain-containing protein [Actinorugispora endophytica]
MDATWAAGALAARQYGVVSRDQVMRCGLSDSALRNLVRRGGWTRVHRGVYRVAGHAPVTERERLLSAVMAAQLTLGPTAFASGRTAARLWGVRGLPPWTGAVHMTVPVGDARRKVPGIIRRTWATDPAEVVARGGLRATTPRRTLRDTLLDVDRSTAVCLLDSALNQGLVAAEDLPALASANTGRPGCARSLPWWGLADGRAQSPLETRVRLVCADGGVPPDSLQHPFHDARGRLVAIGDLWWRDRGLLVEADGRDPHERPKALLHDRRRQNALELAFPGIRILRFTWADLAFPRYIAHTVRAALAR